MKSLRILKKVSVSIFSLGAVLTLAAYIFLQQPIFGQEPAGARLARIEAASNFVDGKFENGIVTPQLAEGYSMLDILHKTLFKKSNRSRPAGIIPSIKTNLKNLRPDQDVLVWFGHSSYFMQIDGKRILVDPIFSGNASPIPGTVKAFEGTDIYTVEELPDIDYLFISHDHYDHLDKETVVKLRNKTGKVICGLGVGAHFERWGYDQAVIIEKNWQDSIVLDKGFTAFVTPARHFSGRGLTRNNTLWCSFLLQSPSMKIYMGGDSGYGPHFAEIGRRFGPIDLAFLENGQYDEAWPYIHTAPKEVLQAARDLNAKKVFPVHSAKFALANHAWDEPLSKITALNTKTSIPLITPVIGQLVYLKMDQQFSNWWTGVK